MIMKINKFGLLITSLVLVCIIITITIFKKDSEQGEVYIKNQETRELKDVESKISLIKEKERKDAISNGDFDPFSLLGDFVFYGDSRVLHYNSYGYIDSTRIFAAMGETIENVPQYNDRLKEMNPKNVFMSYGVNDMCWDLGNDVEGGYGQLWKNAIENIHKIVPNANIYICGLIPVTDAAKVNYEIPDNFDEVNSILKKVANDYSYTRYIDDVSLGENGMADIYTEDGFHFKSEFYPVWTQCIVSGMDQ